MFADYRVPQVLCYLGALHYSTDLRKTIANEILENGGEVEVELRAFSIKACDVRFFFV